MYMRYNSSAGTY